MISGDAFQPFTGAWNLCVLLSDDNLIEARSFTAHCYCGTQVGIGWQTTVVTRIFTDGMVMAVCCSHCGNIFAIQQNHDGIEMVLCYRRGR